MSSEQHTKPLCIVWSTLALLSATIKQIISLENKLREDAGQIVSQAAGWFFHCLHADDNSNENAMIYICMGHEEDDQWNILVRLGTYEQKSSIPNNDSNPDHGKSLSIKIPEMIENPDNELSISHEKLVFDDRETQ